MLFWGGGYLLFWVLGGQLGFCYLLVIMVGVVYVCWWLWLVGGLFTCLFLWGFCGVVIAGAVGWLGLLVICPVRWSLFGVGMGVGCVQVAVCFGVVLDLICFVRVC